MGVQNKIAWLETRLKGVFESLAAGELPLLFHCAAGKDRTGLTAALIMEVIGVPRDTIFEDYLLTNEANLEHFTATHRRAGMGVTDQAHPISLMPPEVRRPLIVADIDYLAAALDQIESEFGSVEGFLQQRLNVHPDVFPAMRETLLVD